MNVLWTKVDKKKKNREIFEEAMRLLPTRGMSVLVVRE